MRQGKVKWYNGKRCFGFVSPDTPNDAGNKDDVFVHSTALRAADLRFLNEGDTIQFDDEMRSGKLSATNIKLISRDEASAKRFQERRNEHRNQWEKDGGHDRHGGEEKRGFFGKMFKKN